MGEDTEKTVTPLEELAVRGGDDADLRPGLTDSAASQPMSIPLGGQRQASRRIIWRSPQEIVRKRSVLAALTRSASL